MKLILATLLTAPFLGVLAQPSPVPSAAQSPEMKTAAAPKIPLRDFFKNPVFH